MKKIRIAFLIDTIDYQFGGTETQLVLLLKMMDRSQFEPYLCCLKDSSWLQDNRDLCQQHIVNFHSFRSIRDWFRIVDFARFLRREKVIILQSHFRDSNIVATIAGKLASVNSLIATRRNLGYWHNKYELFLVRMINPFTARFLVNANAIKKYVESVEHVQSEKIQVIYNGLILDKYKESDEDQRRSLRETIKVDQNDKIITMVANLRPVKGVDVFVNAIATILKSHQYVHFLIVGEGPERKRIMSLISELNLKKHVTLLGKRSDTAEILMASDIGVLSSHSEGLSNALIEYMAAGLPVVCTDVGGNSELVENNVSGILVPPRDHVSMAKNIIFLLDHEGAAKEMGQKGRIRSHKLFNVQLCIEQSQAFYLDVAGISEH